MFWLCLSACSVSKTAGLGIWLMLGAVACVAGFRRQTFRRLALCSAIFFLIVGASPYLTQWIHGGSPFYPAHSFLPERKTRDLTGDFISSRNADALAMGYAGRVAYAWFSPELAKKCSGWWLGKKKYEPVFGWPPANGYGDNFAVLMCLSLLLLPFVRSRRVVAFFVIVSVVDNLAPAKYLGFCRYFPEMYAIPFVTFMGAVFCPKWNWGRASRFVTAAWQVLLSGVAVMTALNLIRWYDLSISMEKVRQDQYAKILAASSTAQIKKKPHQVFETVASRRLLAAGIRPVGNTARNSQKVFFTDLFEWFRTMVPDTDNNTADDLVKVMLKRKQIRHGIMGDLTQPCKQFTNYRFGGYGLPHILFQPDAALLNEFKRKMRR